MKKILHILNSNKLSGAENVVADICMMFKGEYDMAYCSIDGSIAEALKDRDVKFIPINKLGIYDLRRVIKTYKPDIIHAHDSRATFFASIVAGKIPLVSHLHGNHEDMRRISIKSLLFIISYLLKIRKVIVVSESCLNDFVFRKIIFKNTMLLKNIIHFKRLELLADKDQVDYNYDFVFLGRFSYPKNPKRVAIVASMVLKELPDSKFGVIGDGELKDEMVEVFKNEGVIDRVFFTGRLSYPYKALKSAKCMLMCSRYEGLPIAALEALALGVPIVSTPVDGLMGLIIDDQNGYLSDNNSELARHVVSLIKIKDKHENISFNCTELFSKINNESEYKENIKVVYNTL